jgi:polyisoprenoid-binding protein YceI
MKFFSLAAALASTLAAIPALAEVETYNIDPRHTFPAYEVGHMGYSFQRGRFNKTQGKITLDTAAKTGSAEVMVDSASVSSGVEKLDEHLRTPDFFNAERYPQIVFKSTDFVFDGDRVKQARGTLSMNGITRPVTLEVTHFKCALNPMMMRKVCGADMSTTIKRSEFEMKYGLPMLADDVVLRINVEAIKDS